MKAAQKKAPEAYALSIASLLEKAKDNMIVAHSQDDELIERLIRSAVAFAESQQHKPHGYYQVHEMRPDTEQAVLMYVAHFYESRDGSTGGYFGDRPEAAASAMQAIELLLAGGKEWGC